MKLKTGKRTGLKYFNANSIRSWDPCYDPKRYFTGDQRLNAIKILEDTRISVPDRLWCVLRTDLVSEKLMHLFAVWCVRQVQHLIKDQRSLDALDVAERFANGLATREELSAARTTLVAAGNAVCCARGAAAWCAAWATVQAAAADAAKNAAMAATAAAARYAPGDAAGDAAGAAARDAAWAAAWAAARDAQIKKLIEMVKAEGLERVK
jgi:hypothetical protein